MLPRGVNRKLAKMIAARIVPRIPAGAPKTAAISKSTTTKANGAQTSQLRPAEPAVTPTAAMAQSSPPIPASTIWRRRRFWTSSIINTSLLEYSAPTLSKMTEHRAAVGKIESWIADPVVGSAGHPEKHRPACRHPTPMHENLANSQRPMANGRFFQQLLWILLARGILDRVRF